MKKSLSKRMLSALLALVMLLSFAVPVQAEAENNTDLAFRQVDNNKVTADPLTEVAETNAETEPQYATTDVVRVSIILAEESTVQAGYSVENIARNAEAMAYRASLEKEQAAVTAAIEKATGAELDVVWNLTLAANLISADVEYGQIETIEATAGVQKVALETRYEPAVLEGEGVVNPNMATSMDQIGSAAAWAAGYTGAGTRIAIIDTGTDSDHQSFSNEAFLYSLEKQAEMKDMDAEEYIESLNLLDMEEIASVAEELNVELDLTQMFTNEKLPFNYNYIDKGYDVTHDNDAQGGHGSHVAGIAAANSHVSDGNGGFSHALESVMVQGVAPDAQIITMKVFGKRGGAYDSDYMAAVEDAVILGCDAINLSLGTTYTGYGRSFTAEYQLIMENLVNAGAVLCAAAGNQGAWPEYFYNQAGPNTSIVALVGAWRPIGKYMYAEDVNMATHGAPGTYTNTLAVASVENAGLIGYYLKSGDDVIIYNNYQPSAYGMDDFFTLAGDHEYVMIDGLGYAEDWDVVGDALEGKIAIVSRGDNSFVEKATNAVNAGAIATIIYNNQPGVIGCDMTGYTKTNPTVSITQGQAKVIRNNSTPVTDDAGNVLYYTGSLYIGEKADAGAGSTYADGQTMANTSGWGGTGTLLIKPEIAAPGGAIYSVNGENGAYITMSGTSMASPQVAGMTALVMQYIKENGLDEKTGLTVRQLTQSLLMSTSEPMIDVNSGVYYPVLQQGSGLANVSSAISADSYILMDEKATDSWADGKVKAELGDDPQRTGKYEFSFDLYNMRPEENAFSLTASFFAQDAFEDYANWDMNPEETAMYMDYLCTILAANVTWSVDGENVVPTFGVVQGMDFDGNGSVSVDDGQALLDYAVGAVDSIHCGHLADLDEDGDVDTHDAYLFFKAFSTGLVMVPGEGKVRVTVSAQLTEEQIAWLEECYPNGTYIQGYVFAESMATTEGMPGTVHSIPVLAFYGSWTDPSMFDGEYLDYRYNDMERVPYFSDGTGIGLMYPGDDKNVYYFSGNPVVADPVYLPERNAVSNNTIIAGPIFTAIRNAAACRLLVKNETTGETLYEYVENGLIISPMINAIWLERVNLLLQANVALKTAKSGDMISVEFDLAPEYYMDAEGNVDWDALGDGARIGATVTVDSTAPVIENVFVEQTSGHALVVNASDNQYVAGIALFNDQGSALYDLTGSIADIQPGETGQYVLSLAELLRMAPTVGDKQVVYLQVYDYANNMTTYEVDVSVLMKEADYTGMWVGFSDGGGTVTGAPGEPSVYGDGLYNRWFSFVPEKLYFSSPYNETQSGWFDDEYRQDLRRSQEVMVHRAAYANGYVFSIGRDDYMYVSTMSDLTNYQKVCYFGDEFKYTDVTGLAFNHADGQLYLMRRIKHSSGYYDTYEHIFTVDPVTGEMTEQYVLSNIYNPFKSSTNEYERLSGLAIDGEGNFYGLTSSWYYGEAEYLYTWTSDMAVNGVIDGLKPINNSVDGYIFTEYYPDPGDRDVRGMYNHLAWDFENDRLLGAVQWSESDNWEYNVLLEFDLETGKGTLVSDYDGGLADLENNRPIKSLFGYATHAMFFTTNSDIPLVMNNAQTPFNVTMSQTEAEGLRGGMVDLDVDVYPWTMVDKSVTWTTSDPSIATVDENGVVNLVGVGTATITAASNVNPQIQATCQVTSFLPDLNVRGLFTTNDGAYWSEFNPANMPNVTTLSGKVDSYQAGTLVGNTIYTHDGKNLYAIDPITFTATKGIELADELIWADASAVSMGGKDYIFSLCMDGTGTYLIDPATGEKVFDIFMGEEYDLLDDPGVAVDINLNEDRSRPDRGRYVFNGYVLTESGTLYSASYDGMGRGTEIMDFFPDGLREVGNTGLAISGKVSMEYDAETGYVLLAVEEANGVKLYAVDTTNASVADLGTFSNAKSVVSLYLPAADSEGKGTNIVAPANETSLQPNSGYQVEYKESVVTVDVTAEATSNNGKTVVTWDTDKLALESADVLGDHISTIQEEGKFTLGYVSMDGILKGNTTAKLTFNVLEAEDTEVFVEYEEVNNNSGTAEVIFVTFDHSNTEVRGAIDATCTEDGYTGDTYCLDCGKLVAEGEVIPATGHTGELVGVIPATCTKDGYTGDLVCSVCGELLEKGEVIPAHCASQDYSDLNVNAWYHEYTDYVIANGLMNGVGGGKFNPNGTVDRAMMVTVLYRMAGEPEVTGETKFADVKADQWYTDAVIWAEETGIAKGMTEDTFAPGATVTREQAATFLYRYVTEYLGVEAIEGADLSQFKDASAISGYAKEAMAWAVAEELFEGFTDGTIQARETLTRVQLAKLLTVLDQAF